MLENPKISELQSAGQNYEKGHAAFKAFVGQIRDLFGPDGSPRVKALNLIGPSNDCQMDFRFAGTVYCIRYEFSVMPEGHYRGLITLWSKKTPDASNFTPVQRNPLNISADSRVGFIPRSKSDSVSDETKRAETLFCELLLGSNENATW
jgi:hypothetical protein